MAWAAHRALDAADLVGPGHVVVAVEREAQGQVAPGVHARTEPVVDRAQVTRHGHESEPA